MATMQNKAVQGEVSSDRRYAIRINVQIEAELVDQGRRRCPVVLTNLSITGCRFESDYPLRFSAPITLLIDDIEPIVGDLVWADGKLQGCHFRQALRPTICNQIIRTLRKKAQQRQQPD